MNRNTSVFCFVVVCMSLTVAGCSIRILPPYQETDGYMSDWNPGGGRAETGVMPLVTEADSAMIAKLLVGSPFTWVMIAAPWCPHALDDLSKLAVQQHEMEQKGVSILVVSGDYRLAHVINKYHDSHATFPICILSHSQYGERVSAKENRLLEQIGVAPGSGSVYPLHLMVDSAKKIYYSKAGSVPDALGMLQQLYSDGDWQPVSAGR